MTRYFVKIKETIATIISEEKYFLIAEEEILKQRAVIEEFIERFPIFKTTLEPYSVPDDAPDIIKYMSQATAKVGVGPMASIAGAIAQFSLKKMIESGSTHAIIDNGGDIAMFINEPVTVGIFAGPSKFKNVGFRILPTNEIISVCTSSGTVGHSLSFGKTDAAIVVGNDAIITDAVATALGNSVKDEDAQKISEAMQPLLIEGIYGLMAVIGDTVATYGNLPEIVRVNMDIEKISKG
jgi:ApbE superfamily uncharacterized protein (UPF0280 family)